MKDVTPIPDWPGYFATEDGRIFSNRRGEMREMKKHLRHGYHYVHLCHVSDGSQKQCRVNRLIYKTFNPTQDISALQVDHVNGDKIDNRVSNLEAVTAKENCRRYHLKKNK